MIAAGHDERLGASCERDGVNFAIFSAAAEDVELCLFSAGGAEEHRYRLPACTDGVWHGFVPGIREGQQYGFRVHGPYEAERGLRFNPAKLLIDPYARELSGDIDWRAEVFDFDTGQTDQALIRSSSDSAQYVPRSVVRSAIAPAERGPRIPWDETIIYEMNVRGYTIRHPAINACDRGTFRGMRHRDVLEYLRALGVTAVELMPVHAFVDEQFLAARGLRNFWGYNTLSYFAPASRLLGGGPIADFRDMVNTIHDTGLEVILDVVYNHTAEGGRLGPTLSFRGIDNRAYYRLLPDEPGEYVNDTGCGNTMNTGHPAVRRLILDSLRYWVETFGVDGFRFDLAVTLGRTDAGFDGEHALFTSMREDRVLKHVKLIAEPWDVGPGGYQLGGFQPGWAEWNDRFRDAARRFWRGDAGLALELAQRVHGSSELFEPGGRGPSSSVNFVTSHDGFTLADLVSYAERHNEANGEDNRDGHRENLSSNHGVEGPTDDRGISAARRQHRLTLLTTLFCSHGTPMLLAGDEFGNSQSGNNNAYCQDNATGWIDWEAANADAAFADQVRRLIALRKSLPLLRLARFRHGEPLAGSGQPDILWFGADGRSIADADWHRIEAFGLLLPAAEPGAAGEVRACALLFNAAQGSQKFSLPAMGGEGRWSIEFDSAGRNANEPLTDAVGVAPHSAACLVYRSAA